MAIHMSFWTSLPRSFLHIIHLKITFIESLKFCYGFHHEWNGHQRNKMSKLIHEIVLCSMEAILVT